MKKVGILGGGQLAMMMAYAAKYLGLQTSVLAPDANCPATNATDVFVQGAYEDLSTIREFAKDCDVITFEFENVPVRSLFYLMRQKKKIAPDPHILEIIQDRLTEKQFLQKIGLQPAPFSRIDKAEDFADGLAITGLPAVLKTRYFGYDGKGQSWIHEKNQSHAALENIHHHPAVLEAAIPFVRELSVIGARNKAGEFVYFPVTQNHHVDGILHRSSIPAKCHRYVAEQAVLQTRKIAEELRYVGVLAVEFFEQKDGNLLVNEIAPRVHNSGHWTKNGATPDQFEMHLRAITNMKLPMPKSVDNAIMQNLIGDEIQQADEMRRQGWLITDYGKSQSRAGRKMGHAVRLE